MQIGVLSSAADSCCCTCTAVPVYPGSIHQGIFRLSLGGALPVQRRGDRRGDLKADRSCDVGRRCGTRRHRRRQHGLARASNPAALVSLSRSVSVNAENLACPFLVFLSLLAEPNSLLQCNFSFPSLSIGPASVGELPVDCAIAQTDRSRERELRLRARS